MHRLARLVTLALVALLLSLAAAGCGGGDDKPSPTSTKPAATSAVEATALPAGKITVFAAASLSEAFGDVKTAFEAAHDGVSVEFNFAGSPALRTQLQEGARAGVLATADQSNMQSALDAGLVVDAGQPFARNRLVIIVPKGNPAGIATRFDLARPGLKLVLAQEDVPVGNYARQSLDKIGAEAGAGASYKDAVLSNLVSEEPNVKAIVTKVQLGEADAGVVYVTDVTPEVAADVAMIEIPDAVNIVAVYPIAITAEASQPEIAQGFIDFLLSDEGQAILVQHGFMGAP